MGSIDEMGLVKLDLFEVNKIMSCSYLKNVYEGFRFNGSIRDNYIDKKDIVSKSKSNIEVMRRYGRDIIRSLDIQKDNLKGKIERNNFLIQYECDRLLLQFLLFDIKNGYLVWVKSSRDRYLMWNTIGDNGIDGDKLDYIDKKRLGKSVGEGEMLSTFFKKGLVNNKEYIGWLPPYSWYEKKLENDELLSYSYWKDDKRIINNLYPLVDGGVYDSNIVDMERDDYNGNKYSFFNLGMKFSDWVLVV